MGGWRRAPGAWGEGRGTLHPELEEWFRQGKEGKQGRVKQSGGNDVAGLCSNGGVSGENRRDQWRCRVVVFD